MGITIAYDQPVLDLIDELSATGHVTHTQHRKSKVTLHHNGGRLSHSGVLSVWQVRPASAHFNIDAAGTCAQYVRPNEYAWATGSTPGNEQSISIEMCNETVGPEWRVGEATWRGAARLAGWLFARVIGQRPTRDTLVMHKYWSATSCPGPFIDGNYDTVLSVTQQWYDRFVNGGEDDMIPENEWARVRDQVADLSEGKSGHWDAGRTFIGEVAFRNAVTATLAAQSKVLAQIAEDDDVVRLDPEDMAILRADIQGIGENLEDKLDEYLANLQVDANLDDEQLVKIRDVFKGFMYTQMFVLAPKPNTGL